MRVDKLGNRAVTYGIAIFAEDDEPPPRTATSSTCSSTAKPASRPDPADAADRAVVDRGPLVRDSGATSRGPANQSD